MGKPFFYVGGRGRCRLVLAAFFAVATLCVQAGEVARGDLTIVGLGLEVQRDPVVTAVDVPSYVQTTYAAPPEHMAALGDLTGPGIDTPITLSTIPGQKFAIPALHEKGDYLLQNIRLVGSSGEFLQSAIPNVATIQVSDLLTTNVKVRQLTPDELRERGILIDDRNYEVYEYTFIFGVGEQKVEIPYTVIVDKRTRQIIPASPAAFRMLPFPQRQKPPRFTPPYVEPFDLSPGGADVVGDQKDKTPRPGNATLPAALVIPNGFGVLHQFFAVILDVSNSAPAGSNIVIDSITGTIHPPLTMRVARQMPAVAIGQPVPVVDEHTGARFLVAGAQGNAEWTLEAMKAGTHTVDIDVRATYQKPGQDDFPIGGRVSASIVVSDPRFHVNFSHPDTVREGEKYTAYAFVTNLSNQRQYVKLDLSGILPCTSGSYTNNVCRYDASDTVTLDLGPGEMKPVAYKLMSRVNGKVQASAGAASDEAVTVSMQLTMGVSQTGIPLSPATLVMPYYAQFLPPEFVDAQMQLFGLGYSLATAPLSQYTALKPRVITTDVFRRAQQVALAGQRIFSIRRDKDTNVPEENRDAFFHLSLDLLGNVERPDQFDGMPELAEWDELRRTEKAGRIAAKAMAQQLALGATTLTDDYAAATSHRTPFLFAYVHGAPVAGKARPYALSVRGLTSQTLLDVPADAESECVRGLAYGELMKIGDAGELALVGRWSESMRVSVVPASTSFTLHLLYPDTISGKTLRTDIEITNAHAGVAVTIDVARGNRTLIVNGATATPLVNEVGQTPLSVLGAAQDLHLDGGGHVVSLLFNRPITENVPWRDLVALTINVAKANYSVVRRNEAGNATAELQIPAARLQDDGRILVITFDKTLSKNATYAIALDNIASGIVPRVDNDRPAAILTGKVLNGDNTPIANTLVKLSMTNARVQGIGEFAELVQYDLGGADGRYLFEYVPRDLDNGLLGEYNLLTETADGRQASLNGSVRLPGEVHFANLVFLGRGKAKGQVRWDDGTPIPNASVGAGSSLFGGMFSATADANGNYEMDGLPVGPLVFSTVDPDGRMVYATNAIRTAGEVITQDLIAIRKDGPPPGVATVRVTVLRSDTKEPVANAMVGVGSEFVQLMVQYTDSQGRVEFRGVPAGLMSIIASEYSISRHGAAMEVELRGDQVLDQTLVLQVPDPTIKYAYLEDYVKRDDPSAPGDTSKDQPVANAVISIYNLPPITADANGKYVYPDIPTTFSGRYIQVFDPATSRTGWFRVPTLHEGKNDFPIRLSSSNPYGHGTYRVRVYGGKGEPVAGARVFAPGYPPVNYSNAGGGAYELTNVRVPQSDGVMVVVDDANYGEQYAQGGVRVDFDGQIGVSDVRLPGIGTVVVKLEMEQPCSTPPCYAQAIGPVAMTYYAWDDYLQKVMPKTVTGQPDPSTNLVTFTRVPAKQDVIFETVRHPAGYAQQTVRLVFDGDLRNVSLRLKTIGDVSGRVFAHDGITPVAGATVRITTGTAVYAPALTKQDGSFVFAAIPANTEFSIVAELQQDGVFRTAIVGGKTPEGGGPVANLIAVMREQSTIEGQVVDSVDDTVIPLARYWLRELSWPYRAIGTAQEPLTADINGRFVVSNVFTGPFRVTAVAPDNQEKRGDYQGTLAEEGDASQRAIKVRIGGAGAGTVSITVVDPLIGFEPVANAEVSLMRGNQAFDFTTTNDSGVAYFEQVPAGVTYSAFVYSKQRGRSGRSAAFTVVANETVSRSLQLEFLGIVTGSVTDPDTSPSGLPVKGQPVTYSGPISLRATTDSSGNFEFNGVPEGPFSLQAWELATQRIANGPANLFISKLVPEQRNIALQLERMGTLTVKVYLPNDTGGPGELAPLVEVTASQCTICNLYTPDYPYFRSAQGNPVVFPRMFTRVGYGLQVRELGGEARTINSGGGFPTGVYAQEQIVVLPQSGTVEALILDGNGNPVSGAQVAFSGAKQAVVYTGTDGRVSLTGMPFGWYSLQATKGNVSAAAGGELKSRSQPLTLTLNLGTNVTLTGFVEAEEGTAQPSPRTRVIVDVASRLASFRLETLTDDTGHFTFTGIPVGGTTLSLLYFGPDDTTIGARLTRAIADGTTGTIVLQNVKLDATPPRVLAIEPPANATNISPSSPITVTFSEPVKPEYLNRATFELVDTDTPPEIVQSTVIGSLRPDGKTYVVTITPPDPPPGRTYRLKSNMLYRFSIPAGVKDLTGNELRTAIGSSFTTVNYTEPAVVKLDPPETQPVPEQVTFRVKFNKAVTLDGSTITLQRLDAYKGNAVSVVTIARNVDVVDPTTILIAPVGEPIAESAFYRLTVSGVRDTQQPPNVQKETKVFELFSFDHTKPVISIVSPVGAGEKLIAGVLYGPTVSSDATDIAYVDWLDANGTSVFRARTKPFAYSFVAPSNASTFTLKATATDLSGNTSDVSSMTWDVAANAAPSEVSVTNDVPSVYPGRAVTSRVAFKDEGVSVTVALEVRGTALDGTELRQILGSQKITRASTSVEFADATFTWNAPLTLKDGSASVVATVTDSINNATNAQAALTILLDQTNPVVESFLPKAETHYKFGVNGSYTVEVKARDEQTGLARAVITVGGVEVFNGAPAADGTFRKLVSVPPKNADTRVPVTVTVYDNRNNAISETHEVIYERVDDSTLPRAAWITPLDGAVLPSNQTGWLTTLRVRASDDVKVTRVRFESIALAAPIELTAPTSGSDVYETKAVLTFGDAPFILKAIVSDGDPSHDVELPITIEHVAANPVINGEINITATNAAQYADKSVLIRGNVRVYISTPIAFADLMLVDGAVLSVPEETKLDVTAQRLFVDGDSRVDVTAKGWLGGLKTREDNSFTNPSMSGRTASGAGATATADGSYGGIGGSSVGLTNATYGSIENPIDFGAGGGAINTSERGGNGGGFVALRGGRLVLAGIVRADGELLSSGGAGGSVVLDARAVITGAATRVTTNGGDAGASLDNDRGGGGGRIAIRTTERLDLDLAAPVLQSHGGRNGTAEGAGFVDGGAGTVFVNGALFVSAFDERHAASTHRAAGTPLSGAFTTIAIGPRTLARFDSENTSPTTVDATATVVGPTDLPTIALLSTTPAANADVPQFTNITASYTAASTAGIRVISGGDANAYARFAASVSGTPLTIPIAANAAPGPTSIKLKAIDRAGRIAETQAVPFTIVANTAPVVESFDAASETYAGRTVDVTASARDDVAVKSLSLASTGGTVSAQTGQTPTPQTMTRAFGVSLPPTTPSGTTVTLTLTAADDFPNRAATTQSRTFTITKDLLPPNVAIVQPTANQQVDEGSNATFLVDVVATDAEVGVQRVTATLDGVVHELQLSAGHWQKSIPVPGVDGTEPVAKTLAVRAYDYEGNTADASVAFLVKPLIDPNAPVLTWSCASPGALFPAGYEVALRVNATPVNANNGVNAVEMTIGTGTPIVATRIGTTDTFEAKFTIPAGTADGTQLDVRVLARSTAGNESTILGSIGVVSGTAINTASTITASDTGFEDQSVIVVSGGVLTIIGPHRLRNLVVLSGGKVVQKPVDPLRADEVRADRVYIACGGAIDVTALGFTQRTTFPGAGTPDSGSGGSHIGRGATWKRATGGVYGSVLEPKEPGGGGNTAYANEGGGGGVVRIRATGNVIIDGAVRANGWGSALGGGAGGSVWIATAAALSGAGTIEARGETTGTGASGGGAIALDYATTSGTYGVDASGGVTTRDGARTSAAGTIVRNGRDLLIDNKSVAISNVAVTELPAFGRATVAAANANSVTLSDRRYVSTSLSGHRLRAYAADGSVRGTYRLAGVTNHATAVTFDNWALVRTQDALDYDGWLLYAPAGLGGRKFVAVRRFGNDWQYDNDSSFVTFVPTANDVLFATFSKGGGRFTALEPVRCAATCAAVNGIATAEVVAGQFDPDRSTPDDNEGYAVLDAGEIFLRPDAQHRAFTLSAGPATLALEKLSGADVQSGDRLRGVYAFDSIELKNARVISEDLVEGTLKKDAASSLTSGNLGAPVIDSSKVSIEMALNGPVLVGAPGAITDADGPLEVAARNGNSALPPPYVMRADESVGYGTAGGFSIVHQLNALTGEVSTGTLKRITEGYVSFSPSQTDAPMQLGLSPDDVAGNYNEPGHNTFRLNSDGTYQVWANATQIKSGAYAANTAFRIEKSAASMRWYVDNVQVHEMTANVPASVLFECSMSFAYRGEVGSIEYASGTPRSYHGSVSSNGSFRVPLVGAPGDPIQLRARDRHAFSLESDEVQVALYPSNIGVGSLTFSPADVTGGHPATGTVTLLAPAGSEGVLIVLKSDNAIVSVPASITIAPNATSGTFTATTTGVANSIDVNVSATYAGTGVTTALHVLKDLIPPTVTITAPAANAEYTEGQTAKIIVTATITDADSGVKRAWVTLDGTDTPMTVANGVWSAQIAVPFIDGSENVTKAIVVGAEDNSANVRTSDPRPIIIKPVLDNAPPTIAWTCGATSVWPSGAIAKFRVIAKPGNANAGLNKVELTINGQTITAASLGNDVYEAPWSVPVVTADTTYTTTFTATSASGVTASVTGEIVAVVPDVTSSADVSPGSSWDNKTVVITAGTATLSGSRTLRNLIVLGGSVRHAIGDTTLTMNVTNRVYVACGAAIDMSARGYSNNAVYSGPSPRQWTGGSHIGIGYSFDATSTYDSVTNPNLMGGTAWSSGAGGGIIRLTAAMVAVDGAIRSNGEDTTRGGAGGTVSISAGALAGNGTIEARGGDTDNEAGGGGAIALRYTNASSIVPATIARGGTSGRGLWAGAGSIYVAGPSSTYGDLTIDNGATRLTATELPSLGGGVAAAGTSGATLVTGRSASIPNYFKGHWIEVKDKGTWRVADVLGTTLTLAPNGSEVISLASGDAWQGVYRFDNVKIGNGAIVSSSDPIRATQTAALTATALRTTLSAATMSVSGATDATRLEATTLTIESNAVLAHEKTRTLQIVAGTVNLIGSIDVTARGYGSSETYTGAAIPYQWSGGSHLGVAYDFGPGSTYGSVTQPSEYGSGPWNIPAGAGGGVVKIESTRLVFAGGAIRANGLAEIRTGGGGSVWIVTNRVEGGGAIEARAGDTANEAGGGGAIALEYNDASSTLPTFSVRGGQSTRGLTGGAGTIYVKGPNATYGDLLLDGGGAADRNTELPSLGNGTALAGTSGRSLVTTGSTPIPQYFKGHWVEIANKGTWRIESISNRTITLAPNGNETIALAAGDAWQGVYRFDNVRTTNAVTLVSNDPLRITGAMRLGTIGGAELRLRPDLTAPSIIIEGRVAASRITSNDVTVEAGGVLTHETGRKLSINAQTVNVAGTIDVTGRGYVANSTYPGATVPFQWTGGSHLGVGYGFTTGSTFGSVYVPDEWGGPAWTSAPGGGVVAIDADQVSITGTIRANGAAAPYDRYGGGGSIRINTRKITGGSIEARGGSGANEAGGGGAISLSYTDSASVEPAMVAYGGSSTRNLEGGAGTIYVKRPTSVFGDLKIANERRWPTELPSLGSGFAATGSNGSTLVLDRTTSVPGYFVQHWVRVTGKGVWRIGSVAGKSVTLVPNGNESISIAVGDAWEGLYRFDNLMLRQTALTNVDAIEYSTLDKDGTSIFNAGPPQFASALLSQIVVQNTGATAFVVGPAGAVSDPDVPIKLTATNVRTAATYTANANADASFSIAVSGQHGDTFTLRATDSNASPRTSRVIGVSGAIVDSNTIASLTIDPSAVTGGTRSNGTLQMTEAVRAAGATVALASSSANAIVPSSVVIPSGAISVQFPIDTTSPASATTATITATYTNAKSATLTISPAPNALATITLDTAATEGGSSVIATVTLGAEAPAGGALVLLSSSDSSRAAVPQTVVIPAGATSASFPVTTFPVAGKGSVAITAKWGVTKSANLELTACSAIGIASPVTSAPATIWWDDALPSGATATGNATFDTTQAAAGSQSLHFAAGAAGRTWSFTGAAPLVVGPDDQLDLWVLVDPCNLPRQISATWSGEATLEANWGEALVDRGTQKQIGAVPDGGAWVHLIAPAKTLGVTTATRLTGLAIDVYGGEAWFDLAGATASAVPEINALTRSGATQ